MNLKTKVKLLSAIACLSVSVGTCNITRALYFDHTDVEMRFTYYWTEEKIDDLLRTRSSISPGRKSHGMIFSVLYRYTLAMTDGRYVPKTILPGSSEERILVQLCQLVARSSPAGLDTPIFAGHTLDMA